MSRSKKALLSVLQLFFLWDRVFSFTGANTKMERIQCPLRCKCTATINSTEWEVECQAKTSWNKMPELPKNAIYLSINDSNIPTLKPAEYDRGRNTLRTIILKHDNISTVDGKYFQGLNKLKKLHVTKNKLQMFSNNTFVGIPNLIQLNLSYNSFKVIPSQNICLLKKLQILNMDSNNLTTTKFDNCFADLLDLCCIYISHNSIGTIQENDFYSLNKSPIKELYMNNVGLEKLSSSIFKWLPLLRVLDLQDNRLSYLEPDVFVHIPGLTSLILQGNRLNKVPNAAIKNLIYLENLDIQRLNLSVRTLSFAFNNLTHLTNLNLGHNRLYNLTNSTFIGFNNSNYIKEFSLDACSLRKVEADSLLPFRYLEVLTMRWNSWDVTAELFERAFYGLRFSKNLTRLLLDDSNLVRFNNKTFQYLVNTSLQYFQSRGTKLRVLPSGTFHYLPNLQHLDLQSNWIQTLEKNAFPPHNKLIILDLTKNRLANIPNATSVHLENLKCLVLKRNSITWLWTKSFDGYRMLEELDLEGNKITILHYPLFRHGSNLKILHLRFNQLSVIRRGAFAGLNNLTDLIISDNVITDIDPYVFSNTPNLNRLVLSFNGGLTAVIKKDFGALFKPLVKLTVLDMVQIGLQELPKDIFINMTNLTILTLSRNFLTNLDPVLFQNQQNLKLLTIMKNKLSILKSDVLKNLPNLEQLDVSSNAFACDCGIQWFADWIRLRHVYVRRLDSTTCIPPKQKNNVPLLHLHLERECMSFTFYYVYWLGLVSYMCLVTLATELYRLRWYIRYWMHLVRDRRAKEREMEEGRYVFDAFVSYANEDEEWVVNELLPKVEYEAKIRLCLHQRNWVVGKSIIGNIVNSIEKSRKTVLVLSNSFARSKWADMEMSLAQNKLLTTRRDVIVPILLEEIQKKYVTEQMVCLFATQTYIKWPKRDERKQRRNFWAALIKALRPQKAPPIYDDDNDDFITSINDI